jgi:hypothetical protein
MVKFVAIDIGEVQLARPGSVFLRFNFLNSVVKLTLESVIKLFC